jgi:hypothetical protein
MNLLAINRKMDASTKCNLWDCMYPAPFRGYHEQRFLVGTAEHAREVKTCARLTLCETATKSNRRAPKTFDSILIVHHFSISPLFQKSDMRPSNGKRFAVRDTG